MNQQLLIEIQNLKRLAIRFHDVCDDPWYNCPKCEEGCPDVSKGTNCTCNADRHNEQVQDCYNKLVKYLI